MTPVDRQPGPDDQHEALTFLRSGRALRGLSPAQYRRVGQRLAYPVSPPKRRLWVPALAVFGVLLVAGTALARVVDFSQLPLIGRIFPAPITKQVPRKGPSKGQAALSPKSVLGKSTGDGIGAAAAPEARPSGLPAPASAMVASAAATIATPDPSTDLLPARRPRKSLVREAPIPSAPVAPASQGALPRPSVAVASSASRADPVLAESRSFSEAAARWHRDHNAKSALDALDAHERGFPGGQMQTETQLLRAEILLQQGREPESLALLDKLHLSELPRGRELLTVRGELRVKYGRCPEARRDLDRVLSTNHGDALARRAARALALCP